MESERAVNTSSLTEMVKAAAGSTDTLACGVCSQGLCHEALGPPNHFPHTQGP